MTSERPSKYLSLINLGKVQISSINGRLGEESPSEGEAEDDEGGEQERGEGRPEQARPNRHPHQQNQNEGVNQEFITSGKPKIYMVQDLSTKKKKK